MNTRHQSVSTNVIEIFLPSQCPGEHFFTGNIILLHPIAAATEENEKARKPITGIDNIKLETMPSPQVNPKLEKASFNFLRKE